MTEEQTKLLENWEAELEAHHPFMTCRQSFHDSLDYKLEPGNSCLKKLIKRIIKAAKAEQRERDALICEEVFRKHHHSAGCGEVCKSMKEAQQKILNQSIPSA